jgi:hypothetical protein
MSGGAQRKLAHRKLAAVGLAACCAVSAAAVSAAAHQHGRHTAAMTAYAVSAGRARPQAVSENKSVRRKKGVSAWAFRGARAALHKSGVSWYYTWSVSHNGITTPRGVAFVPMIWGPGSVTTSALQQARHEGHVLLGFNEPDMSSQSNMTVDQALSLWPRLMRTGMRLGSPAVAFGGDTPGGWLARFMGGAKARHYRVSFITLHWYGGDFRTAAAVSQLRSYLQAVWKRYHKPIWLTEFALIRFGAKTVFPSPRQQAAFVTRATAMLQKLRYLWRYSWFALPYSSGDGSAGLFRPGAVPTTAGRAFERVGS